jgi:hypothetical protein
LEPFFVSKKKVDFDNGGKRLRRKLVLAGERSRAMARRLVREGIKLIEAGCHLREDDGRILVEGIEKSLRKAAAKTVKVLQVGRKLGEAAPAEGGKGSTDKPLPTMRIWSKAKGEAEAAIHEVCSQLRETGKAIRDSVR